MAEQQAPTIADHPGVRREVARAIQDRFDELEETIRLQAQRIRELEAELARSLRAA